MARRKRNRQTEQWVADKQARLIGVHGDERVTGPQKLMEIIDQMDGDYFQPALHPAGDRAFSAWDNMVYTGPKSDLDRELIAQARRHYGLDKPTTPTAAVQAAPVVAVAPKPVVAVAPKPAPVVVDEIPKPPPVQAEELKQEYVNEILGYDLNKKINEIREEGNRGMIFKNMHALEEAALFGGLALASGGGYALGKSGEEEEERLPF